MEGKGWLQCVILMTLSLVVSGGCESVDESAMNGRRVSVKVSFSGNDFISKAADPQEDMVTDVSLMVFDEHGDAEACLYAGKNDAHVFNLDLVAGRTYSFRACANFGSMVYADRIEELEEVRFYLAYPDEYREGMPMCCSLDDVMVRKDTREVVLSLERLMAKVSLRVDRSRLSEGVDMEVKRVTVGNCPRSASVFLPGGNRTRHDSFPVGFSRNEMESWALNEGRSLSGAISLYVLENIQGEFSGSPLEDDSHKVFPEDDPRRELCSYVEMEMDYLSEDKYSASSPLVYRFYLGGSRDDLNVERNCIYDITVTPSDDGLGDDGWRVDKSGIGLFVKDIVLSDESLSFTYKGQTGTLSAEVLPSDAEAKYVFWESDDSSVASVDIDGTVEAVGEGKCNITCLAADGSGVYASCQVEVAFADTWFRSYPESYVRGNVGDKVHLWCEFFPPNAEFSVGYEELEADRKEGLYTYETDPDGHGVTLTLAAPGRGIVYMEAGPPLNEAAMWVIEINQP